MSETDSGTVIDITDSRSIQDGTSALLEDTYMCICGRGTGGGCFGWACLLIGGDRETRKREKENIEHILLLYSMQVTFSLLHASNIHGRDLAILFQARFHVLRVSLRPGRLV